MSEQLRYRGDVRDFDPDQMLGPDFGGRRLRIASVDYDEKTNVSTATLRGVLPDQFRELVEPQWHQAREHARIRELFLG